MIITCSFVFVHITVLQLIWSQDIMHLLLEEEIKKNYENLQVSVVLINNECLFYTKKREKKHTKRSYFLYVFKLV